MAVKVLPLPVAICIKALGLASLKDCSSLLIAKIWQSRKPSSGNAGISCNLVLNDGACLQYCADAYQKALNKSGIKCSMTNNGDPYENAVAERINGILKQEFMIDTYHQDTAIMKIIVKEAIDVYKNQRPHYSNYMLTPELMHNQSEILMRTYKTKKSSNVTLATL